MKSHSSFCFGCTQMNKRNKWLSGYYNNGPEKDSATFLKNTQREINQVIKTLKGLGLELGGCHMTCCSLCYNWVTSKNTKVLLKQTLIGQSHPSRLVMGETLEFQNGFRQ